MQLRGGGLKVRLRHVWVRTARHHAALAKVLAPGDGHQFTGAVYLAVPRVWTRKREIYWCDVIGEATEQEVTIWTARKKKAA